jgi:hypothetical protein
MFNHALSVFVHRHAHVLARGEADEKGAGIMLGYDWHNSERYLDVQIRQYEMHAAVQEARLARQARGGRRLRRSVGTLLISIGEALAYQPGEAMGGECRVAPVSKNG